VPLALARQWTSHSKARWQHEFNMRLLGLIEEFHRAKPAPAPSTPKLAPRQPFDLEAKGLTPASLDCDHSILDCDTDN
jgi:hypothetical protein